MIAFASLFLGLVVGVQSVAVLASAPVAAVQFQLDGQPAGRTAGKPWAAEIDFGRELEPHKLVAVALDAKGTEIGRATQWLNLPRPAAEIEIVLERDERGRATAARLTSTGRTAAGPTRVSLTLDRKPLSLDGAWRAVLPGYDQSTPHVLSAEVEFPSDVRTRSDIVLGGGSTGEAKSELTAVAFRVRAGAGAPGGSGGPKGPTPGLIGHAPGLDSLRGGFSEMGQALHLVAVDHGPADVLVVRDFETATAVSRLGNRGPFIDRWVEKGDRVRIVWPTAMQIVSLKEGRAELFAMSRFLTRSEGGFYNLLARLRYPDSYSPPYRFADAVAIAGLQGYSSGSRRAVVLVVGTSRDDSIHAPAVVRRYLERIQVPLHVWSLTGVSGTPSPWGEVEDVSSLSGLSRAVARLKEDLAAQYVAWFEGRHRPQDIVPAQVADIELAR